jgi:hypothetical protein
MSDGSQRVCPCGSTEFWSGQPPICKACKKAMWPKQPEQASLPGFALDPVPHAPPPPESAETAAPEREERLGIVAALGRLRAFRASATVEMRAAIDAVLDELEPKYPEPSPETSAAAETAQPSLFELGAPAPAVAAKEDPIRVYVHFERAADVAEFGRLIGVQLGSSVRLLRYSRERAASVVTGEVAPLQPSGERDKTFADLQTGLFGSEEWWEQYWHGMPEFVQKNLSPVYSIEMEFDSWADVDHFEAKIGQTVPRGPKRTPSVWFPEAEIWRIAGRSWRTREACNPRYPVFIISKGRADTRLTQRHFEANGIPYRIVVEPQEFEQYAAVVPREKVLATPFSNLGQGSIPVRNFCWQTAVDEGHAKHFVVDDNIDGLYRLHENLKLSVETGATLRAIEDWSDRYENVGLSGPNYFMFASRKTAIAPLTLNTRVYSCILVNHSLDGVIAERWRGRYNEDTDLSIRALKAGWCTALFNAFLILKQTTMTMKGGNTEALYKIKEGEKDGRLLMAESLQQQHPDITQIVTKWGRSQHSVDYRGFRQNQLRLRDGVEIPRGRNNYGMELVEERRAAA